MTIETIRNSINSKPGISARSGPTDGPNTKNYWPKGIDDMSKLREYRLAAGLSQAALAQKAGCHKTMIQRAESGERNIRNMSAEVVVGIADALKTHPRNLFD